MVQTVTYAPCTLGPDTWRTIPCARIRARAATTSPPPPVVGGLATTTAQSPLESTSKEARVSANTVEPQLAPDPPAPGRPTPRFRRRMGAVLDRWPFRRKLNVLVVVPIAVVGV